MAAEGLPDKLPILRAEITIRRGGADFNNMPTWLIFDPNSNKYFQIGWMEYEFLRRWSLGSPQKLLKVINEQTTLTATEEDLQKFITFLSKNYITQHSFESIKILDDSSNKPGILSKGLWLFKNYLFLRIPLLNPDRFLEHTLRYVEWLFAKRTLQIMLLLAVIAIIMVIREWDMFISSIVDTTNWLGFIYLIIGIFLTKVVHECGHAYMCKKQGCKVPTMGVALLVMWPVMYTDTSDSWKLRSNKRRLYISLAGMWLELYLSVVATWLWIFVGPGAFRNALFFIASTSWIISVFINISPFLRFDGYYVLSDLWGVRNLQARSFELARWWLRTKLFGLDLPMPEPVSRKQRYMFTTYALCTWVYRLFLYIGIAVLIYTFFFKILGVIMFIVELIFFIGAPVFKELKVWWEYRSAFKLNLNTIITSCVLVFFVAIFFIPWDNSVSIPATLSYAEQRYYTPEASQVDRVLVKVGAKVKKGQTLVKLHSGHLQFQLRKAQHEVQRSRAELEARSYTQKSRQDRLVVTERLKQASLAVQKARSQLDKLTIKADSNGHVTFLASGMRHAMWVRDNKLLLVLVDDKRHTVEAFIPSNEVWRVEAGAHGVFVPEALASDQVKVKISAIDYQDVESLYDTTDQQAGHLTSVKYVDTPAYHASVYGGPINVRENEGKLVPEQSYYRILLTPIGSKAPLKHVERGTVVLPVKSESWAHRFWNIIVSAFIKESSF